MKNKKALLMMEIATRSFADTLSNIIGPDGIAVLKEDMKILSKDPKAAITPKTYSIFLLLQLFDDITADWMDKGKAEKLIREHDKTTELGNLMEPLSYVKELMELCFPVVGLMAVEAKN